MNSKYNKILTIIIFAFWAFSVHAQTFIGNFDFTDKSQSHLIIFKNNTVKYGRIISIENNQLTFLEKEGNETQTFQLAQLDKIMVDRKDIDLTVPENQKFVQNTEKVKFDTDLQTVKGNNRLFYSETAFTLNKRELEFNSILGLVHTFDYGLNDALTLGFGFTNFGHIILHTKFNYIHGYDGAIFRAGIDIKGIGRPERTFNQFDNREEIGWTGFVNFAGYFSYGSSDRNVHLSINLAPVFEPFDFFDQMLVKINFGGTIRVARHWKIIYENSFGVFESNSNDIFGLFSGIGANWFNDKNAIKFGLQSSPNFGVFNFPISEFNENNAFPFFSYSRYF